MMFNYKFFYILFILFILFIFINLGQFLDITVKPKKADIIVSLGGGSGCRLKTALHLYKQNFSNSNKFIYTGRDFINSNYSKINSKKDYLINNNINSKNIIHINMQMIHNTMEEVFFIKEYMLKNNYKSVLFVSHPQHSRRIAILANLIANYKNSGLTFEVASCNPSWWNKRSYYLNKTSLKESIRETIKIIYNILKYSPLLISYTNYTSKKERGEWKNAIQNLN